MYQEELPYILITIGIVNIALIFYLRFAINKIIISLSKAITLNKEKDYEVEGFLENIDDILYEMDIRSHGYEIFFLDEIVRSKKLNDCKSSITETIEVNDHKVKLYLCPNRYIGENVEKFNIIAKMLNLIIHTNLLIKSEATNRSFANISKYHTFLLHDVKNISQYIKALEHNINECETDEEKLKLFKYLKDTSADISARTSRVIENLSLNNSELFINSEISNVDIKECLNILLERYEIDIQVEEETFIETNEEIVKLAFENIIKNFKDKQKNEPEISLKIDISKEKENIIVSFRDSGTKIKELNKLFEPFVSTKIDGLGIGLYQSKTLLKTIDSDIVAANLGDGVEFKIYFKW